MEEVQVSIIDDWLARIGFEKTSRPGWTVWNFAGEKLGISNKNTKNSREKKSFAPSSIWRINQIEVTERKGQHQVSNLSLSLDYGLFKRSITQAAKKFYGARTTVTIVECDKGSFWVFLEFVKSATKKSLIRPQSADFLPYGVAGFKVGLGSSASSIEIYFSEFFGVGFVPQVFISSHMRIIHEALGLKKIAAHHEDIFERKSLFEFHLSQNVALALLAGGDAVPKELMVNRSKQSSLRFAFSEGKVDFTYGQGEHPFEISTRSVVPLIVLESRESETDLTEVDELLVSGKISKASKKILDYTKIGKASPYLSRRLWLLVLCGQIFPENLVSNSEAGAEVETKLFLSCLVRGAASKADMPKVLDSLSTLGRMLAYDLNDIESVKSFDLVIPELLGDAWLPSNTDKADICYERILQRCGELPRILRKMISIAEANLNFTREFELCLRLSVVERRRNELAKVYFRLAELSVKFPANRGNPLDFAFKSLQNDRNFFQSALLAANLLNQDDKPNEAIGLLDQLLSDPTVAIPQKAKALLEYQIGVTWHLRLARLDLAERRYERSIELDPSNIDALIQLESIYRSSGQVFKICSLLEKQFDAFERIADVDSLKRIFEELIELYRGPLDRPQKGYELYQRMLALAIVEPEEIDKLMSWRDIQIDWRTIYNTLIKNLTNLPVGELSARYHIRLAEICRDKLDDLVGAYNHYRSSLDHGSIDTNGFRMIVEKLAADQSYDQLATCFETRLVQLTGQDRVNIILELLSFPSVLSDSRRDQLAIEAFVEDADQATVMFQRIKYYQSMDDVDGLERFAAAIVQLIKSTTKSCTWVRHVIESLQECVDPAKYRVIDKLFRVLVTIDTDPQSILVEAINLFKETLDAGRCNFYVRELLKIDEIPNLSPKLVARYLVGYDADLAKFHYLRALSSKIPQEILTDARLSIAVYKRLPGHHAMQEKCLHLIGSIEVLTDLDMRELKAVARVTENWADLVRTLQKQAELVGDSIRRYELLVEQGSILWEEMKDNGRARLSYLMAMNGVENKAGIKLILARLAEESGQQEQELRALIDYVLDEHSGEDLASLKKAILRMFSLGKEPFSIYKLIRPKLGHMSDGPNMSDLLAIADIFIKSGFLNQELFQLAFSTAVNARLFDEAIEYWWQGLKSIQSRSAIKSYLVDTKVLLESAEREDLMLKCYRAAIQNGVADALPEKVRQEVLVEYGLILFDSDLRRSKALPVFKEAYNADRNDNRTWLPIYFILEEQGDITQQYLFLKEMIVLLREDLRPLRQYPVTIESLEMQLRELASFQVDSDLSNRFVSDRQSLKRSNESNSFSKIDKVPEKEKADLNEPHASSVKESSSPLILRAKKNDKHVKEDNSTDDVREQKLPLAMVSGEVLAPPHVSLESNHEPHLSIAASYLMPEDAQVDADSNTVFYDSSVASQPVSVGNDYVFDLGQEKGDSEVVSKLHLVPAESQLSEDYNIDLGFAPSAQSLKAEVQIPLNDPPSEPSISFSMEELSEISDLSEPVSPISSVESVGSFSLDLASPPEEAVSLELKDPTPGLNLQMSEFELNALDPGANPNVHSNSNSEDVFPAHSVSESSGIPLPVDPGSMSLSLDEVSEISLNAAASAPHREAPEVLDPNVSGDNFDADQEVSSIELAAAIDLKALLPEDEYSSAELRNSGSLLAEMKSGVIPRSEDSMEGSIQKVSAGLEAGNPNSVEAVDWRSAILSGSVAEDLTETLMKQAFANEVEKHVALQCVALIAGNCQFLDSWHWRVWRNSKEYGYQLSGRERFNSEFTSPALQSQLHQFVIACNPLMAKVFRNSYTIEHLSKIIGTSTQNIEKARKQVSWQQGLLNDVGFHLYRERIEKRGYKAFNLPGLGGNIFFEGPQKSVYFDEAHFQKQPPGALFHRVLSLLWSIRLQYYIPLALNPKKQVMPFLAELHQKLDIQGISKLTEKIKSKSPLSKYLASVDLRTLQSLKAKTGVPTEAQVSALWFAMQEHIFKLILSETLDVVGLLEAILSKDLIVSGSLKPKEIISKSPYAKSLLVFATKLVV